MRSRSIAAVGLAFAGLLYGACAGHEDPRIEGPEPTAWVQQPAGGTVQDAVNGTGCSTAAIYGLSVQIVEMLNCMHPNALAEVPSKANLSLSGAVFPYLQTPARDALVAALDSAPSMTLNSSSMLRTVAQQYMLYAWYLAGKCGIPLAATPGNSNHESGLALDTSDYNAWRSTLESHGFDWLGSSDVYHFDYAGGGTINLYGEDVLAFQKLWNQNNPGDLIDEDGVYGPQTEARIKQSPADGFPGGVDCGGPEPDAAPPPPDAEPEAEPPVEASVEDTQQPPADAPPVGQDAGPWPEAGEDDANDPGTNPYAYTSSEPEGCACGVVRSQSNRGLVSGLGVLIAIAILRRRGAGRVGRSALP